MDFEKQLEEIMAKPEIDFAPMFPPRKMTPKELLSVAKMGRKAAILKAHKACLASEREKILLWAQERLKKKWMGRSGGSDQGGYNTALKDFIYYLSSLDKGE